MLPYNSTPMTNKNVKYITLNQLATILGISYSRAFTMLKSGKIKGIRPGYEWLVNSKEALGWQKVRHKSKIWLERKLDPVTKKPTDEPLEDLTISTNEQISSQ